jgi:hypothetical protein
MIRSMVVALAVSASATVASAQTPAAAPAQTDVYHVTFVKAAPGQAAALAKELLQPDPKNPMGSHFILLRHQEGADWDYCLIEHVGTKASVEITPPPAATATPTRAWHDDTFVSGPAWPEFQRVTGLTGDQSGSPVYVVGTHRAVPGHREQLLAALNQPPAGSKPVTGMTLTHIEGGQWQFLTVTRYSSWQELGADRPAAGAGADAWAEIRQHSASHADTIADRVK